MVIKRTKGKYQVRSERTGRNLGTYDTYEEAESRRKQVEMFSHMKRRR